MSKYKGKMRYEFLHIAWAACVMFDCHDDDIAYLLGVGAKTFQNWLARYSELAEYVKRGRAQYIYNHPEEYPDHPITKAEEARMREAVEKIDICQYMKVPSDATKTR